LVGGGRKFRDVEKILAERDLNLIKNIAEEKGVRQRKNGKLGHYLQGRERAGYGGGRTRRSRSSVGALTFAYVAGGGLSSCRDQKEKGD